MKTTLIRTLAIAILATSMSAFAVTGEMKGKDAASPCASSKQDNSGQDTKESKKEKKSKKTHDEQNNSNWLLGIYG